jgi:hypothetical protein
MDKTKKHPKRRTVHLTIWTDQKTKEELQIKAKNDNISLSAAGNAFMKRGLQQDIDMQYGALLAPTIETSIRKSMESLTNRLTFLAVRNTYDSGQIRGILINVLGRMPGVTPEILNAIIDDAAAGAKNRIKNRTPQFDAFLAELRKWFEEKERTK